MPSNVELANPDIKPIIDDPSIDVFTQRPRTPNKPRSCNIWNQTTAVKNDASVLFNSAAPVPEDKSFPKDRYTYTIKGENLYGKSRNLQYVGDAWSRYPEWKHSGSRDGAYFPWPPNKAGDKVATHKNTESPSTLYGIELVRRPPTNLPGIITMKFGRAAPGYYAQRYPNKETWSASQLMHRRNPNTLYSLPDRTLAHYEMCDEQQKCYLSSLPETTEYQDRYLGHLPTEKRRTFYRDCLNP